MPALINEEFTAAQLRVVPTPVVTEGAGAPDNSEIRKAAEAVLGGLKYTFAAVAANPGATTAPGTVEDAMRHAIAGLPQARRDRYVATATDLVKAAPRVRSAFFGPAGETEPRTFLERGGLETLTEHVRLPVLNATLLGVKKETLRVPVSRLVERDGGLVVADAAAPSADEIGRVAAESLRAATASEVRNSDRLAEAWGRRAGEDPWAGALVDGEFEPFAATDKLGLWISQIKCVDETNPEWWGSDEIALAGVEVDEDGDTKKIGEKYIGGGFDDGDAKNYANWRYTWFSLAEGQYWPKRYSVSFILAEKDHGGLQSFLDSVWQKVKEKVKEAIAKAIGTVASAYLGPVIGSAIGQAVAWVVDVFVQWLINLFGDDIFPVRTVSVTTPSAAARWYYPNGTWGNPSSGTRVANFYGHGGHYQIRYHWMFHA
jgi:hypothetical protein